MAINGLYEIVEMEIWDKKKSNPADRARISIQGRKGTLHFIGFDARMEIKKTGDRYLFTWVVSNESDSLSGYGNFTCSGDTLTGRIYMHEGYDSAFVAIKSSKVKKSIKTIDRSLLLLKAKEPFREWVGSLPGKGGITLRDMNTNCQAYLIPEFDGPHQRNDFLNAVYGDIFVKQLLNWCSDNVKWPMNRTFALFKRWFEPEYHSIVEDMVDRTIVYRATNLIYEGAENGDVNIRE